MFMFFKFSPEQKWYYYGIDGHWHLIVKPYKHFKLSDENLPFEVLKSDIGNFYKDSDDIALIAVKTFPNYSSIVFDEFYRLNWSNKKRY